MSAQDNDVGVRLLKKEPGISVTAIDRSKEMQKKGNEGRKETVYTFHQHHSRCSRTAFPGQLVRM